MPSIGALSINDGQTTPVARSFVVAARGPVVVWENRTNVNPLAWPTITFSGSRNPKTGIFKGRVGFAVPTVHATTGEVLAVSRLNSEIILSQKSLQAQRDDLWAFAKNFIAFAQSESVIKNMEPFF